MPKRVILVGHCGPDASYLRQAVKAALGDVTLASVDDTAALENALAQNADLLLLNRDLGYDLTPSTGVEMIRLLKQKHPEVRTMLVSNYADAQKAAVEAGALPGFGKRELGSPRVTKLLQDAIAVSA
jgi:two-component system chemotaxis response regulator CheY